jgi:hypothetical protein
MSHAFEFDEKKSAQENIADSLVYTDSIDKTFAALLRQNIDKMLPLPEAARRGTVRAAFNGEIKKKLDAALAAAKAKNG